MVFKPLVDFYNANFYVHIKSQGRHGVYGPHGDKKLAYALKEAYKA